MKAVSQSAAALATLLENALNRPLMHVGCHVLAKRGTVSELLVKPLKGIHIETLSCSSGHTIWEYFTFPPAKTASQIRGMESGYEI
jgi:hypothetical protein